MRNLVGAQGIYGVTRYRNPYRTGLVRTGDLGFTWDPPCSFMPSIGGPLVALVDTIYCQSSFLSFFKTSDGGCTFSDSMATGFPLVDVDVAIGGGWIHMVGAVYELGFGQRLYYTRAPLGTEVFETPRDIHANVYWTNIANIECDDEGTVIILSSLNWVPPVHLSSSQALDISHDFGETWVEVDTLTPFESATIGNQGLCALTERWLAVW
ncbi:MAG: hypothetical protein IPP40_15215 [bacterium]|nr:hypothetical protein [bacterium]